MLLLVRFIAAIPMWAFYSLSELLILILRISNYRGHVILTNLKNSFPDSTEAWRKKIKLQFYRNFSDLIV
jgi:KDO2-lipid IV(A) lauroyltransferase